MNASPDIDARTPLTAVLEWWSSTRARWARMAELRDLPPGEFARVAADFGVSPAELVEASARPDGRQDLLEKRLAALHVDRNVIAELLPVLMRDLERTCGACPDKKHCAKDMAKSAIEPGWETYCPNSGTLRALL